MKKMFIIFSSVLIVAGFSCGDSSTDTKDAATKPAETVEATEPAVATADPKIAKGLELITNSDCLTCHKLNEASTGPAYAAIAAKYQGQNVVDSLAQKVIKGGSGVWGVIPMLPHPQLSKEDAATMVTYVLSVK